MHIYILLFIFGAVIGSFLNVCIYRIPRGKEMVFSRSMCPHCKKTIVWYDNIPFLSYIFLRGRCRWCHKKISFRYFIVEFLSAITAVLLYMHFGFSGRFFIYSAVTFSLIVITFIDFDFKVIPDRISIGGTLLGLIFSTLFPQLHGRDLWRYGLLDSFLGIITGGAIIYITGAIGNMAFKKESMGGGDIKLMAMLGAFLGWKKAVLVFFLAPFFAVLPGLYMKFKNKEEIMPYGPYISAAAFFVMLWGQDIIRMIFFPQ